MTQTRWWITALLLSALVAGASRGDEPAPKPPAQEKCPILGNIPYLNQLFKNVSVGLSAPSHPCPCKPGKPCEGCCCSEKKDKPAMRCCPATGVCCPAKPSKPAIMPPPAPAAMPYTVPAPMAVPLPPVAMCPCPPMPPPSYGTYPVPPPPPMSINGKTYVVELKVMETRPGEEEKVVARPEMMVVAGQTASLCFPVAAEAASPVMTESQGMVGEQGVEVSVIPAGHHGHVVLDVTIHKDEQDCKGRKCFVERMSAVRICKQVKLGRMVKLPCEVPTIGEKIHCRIEATVKDGSMGRDVSVAAPPMMPPGCPEACPCPIDGPAYEPIAPVTCIPVMPRCKESATKHFSKMTFHVIKEDGKSRLEIENGNARVVCEKTVLQLDDCAGVNVAVVGKQVSLSYGHPASTLKVKADRVSTAPHGCLLLEGHVHVEGAGHDEMMEIQGSKVRLKLPEILQTGVIASPTLVQ